MTVHQFPADFVWGAATSSQQIEGGRHENGRGESIWDRFATLEGKIEDGSNPDIACNHFHLWRDDIALMKWLGLKGYRFSLSWPRIQATGLGAPNEAGLDFYDSLVDGLLEAGIEPFPTLYHWDLPQNLQERGGWGERDTAKAFVEYASIVARRIGDRVQKWVTHNEPWCIATLGHEEGHHAPGHDDPAEALRVAHHILLSHGWATEAIKHEIPSAEVGIVLINCPAYPETDSEPDKDAARWFDGFFNRWYLDPLFHGSYPADAIADRIALGHLKEGPLPFVQDGDMAAISTPTDFLGLNYYSRAVMKAGSGNKPVSVNAQPSEELTDMGWEVFPQGFYDALMRVHNDYQPRKIYITENGAAYDYPADGQGRIADQKRINYFQEHLLAVRRAMADGVPVHGYFAWSLMDNFEWGFGYAKRFGLFSVNYDTQKRSPKDSAFWYKNVLSTNAVDDAATPINQGEIRAFNPKQ